MPQRFLRPGIRTSAAWNKTSFPAQSLYLSIMTLVDDFGRYDGRAALLHGECFSLRSDMKPQRTAALLQELNDVGLIQLYEHEGKEYLQVLKWQERSRSDKSKYPDPPAIPQDSAAERMKARPPSPSSSPSPLHHRHSSNGSQANTSEPSDEEWLSELAKSKAYQGIDVPREFAKMGVWCRTAKKQPSRRRFINWLNKCDRPMNGKVPIAAAKGPPKPQPPGWDAWRQERYPDAKERDFWRVPDDVKKEFQDREKEAK